MDVVSYLLGKNAGGGGGSSYDWAALGFEGEPISIQKGYDYAKNIQDNWDSSITTMYVNYNGLYQGDSNLMYFPLVDTSNVVSMEKAFNNSRLTKIALIDTSNVTTMNMAFYQTPLYELPLFNTSKVTDMKYAFQQTNIETLPQFDTKRVKSFQNLVSGCPNLKNVPVLDTTCTTLQTSAFNQPFKNCPNLTNESLNNIMKMCINATAYTGTKTLAYAGLSQEQANICMTLSNYQDFVNAGWTTGY